MLHFLRPFPRRFPTVLAVLFSQYLGRLAVAKVTGVGCISLSTCIQLFEHFGVLPLNMRFHIVRPIPEQLRAGGARIVLAQMIALEVFVHSLP